jgi:hypothetical protein
MPRIRPRELTLALAGGAALVGLVALTAAAGTGNEARGTGSSFSNRPDGARAAYLTLRELGYRVERSHEPLAALAVEPASAVLVLASPQVMFSNQDRRALTEFVEGGGIALATGLGGALALGRASKAQDVAPLERERRIYQALEPSELTAGAGEISMAVEVRAANMGEDYRPLYGESGEHVALTARIGEGRIVWWAGSTPLTNEAIADAGNFELLLNVLGDGGRLVLWDEHYHGHARSLWSYAAGTPLPWAGAQVTLLALAALLTWSRRPGPIRPRVQDARTSPMEFVETMGGLYRRAGIAQAAVASAAHRLRRALASSCGLPATASDDQLATVAASRTGVSRDLLAALLRDADDAAATPGTDADALAIVARLQAETARARESRRGSPARSGPSAHGHEGGNR